MQKCDLLLESLSSLDETLNLIVISRQESQFKC